jgi:nucleotide-binding universal stress UspA family protein
MAPRVIVSYDGTANDEDALALGRLFADAGAEIALAYVRHTQEAEDAQERLEEKEADALLERGAASLGGNVQRHVVLSASTPEGLSALAERERADVIAFGSDYRTSVGQVQLGTSASRLLDGGSVAIAVAPAGVRDRDGLRVARVGVIPDGGDPETEETARALAASLGAQIARSTDEPLDFLVVGSRPEAPPGVVMVSAATEYAIENAACPVLVVPRGVTVPFGSTVAA